MMSKQADRHLHGDFGGAAIQLSSFGCQAEVMVATARHGIAFGTGCHALSLSWIDL